MLKVSVIIPVYNVEKYLGECLDSILGQTLKDIEVLCVDDGSTDNSARILADYAAKDSRVKVLHQDGAGAGVARNNGLAAATGEHLYFCDADDWIDSVTLAEMHRMAEAANADIVSSGIRYFDDQTRHETRVWKCGGALRNLPQPISPTAVGPDLFQTLRVQTGGKLYRHSFVKRNGLVFQEQPRVNDLAFAATAIALAERIYIDGRARYHYRKNHGGSLSSRINEMPEMAALAWLRVKENLDGRSVFGRFRQPFSLAASQALVNSLLAMTDAAAAERFHRRIVSELIPALGLRADDVTEDARPLFSGAGALEMFVKRLATERENTRRIRERLIECTAELSRIKGGRCWRVVSFLQRLFGLEGR